MSVSIHTPQDIRKNYLVQIARLFAVFTILGAVLFVYQGIATSYWPYFLMAGAFGFTFVVAISIVRSRDQEHPVVGVWHLLFAISLSALLLSSVHPNPGSGLHAAILIIISTIVIQSLPREKLIQGVDLGRYCQCCIGFIDILFTVPANNRSNP